MDKKQRQLHLALGGGGARALAHLGVLKVIEEHQLPIARLSGTSGGATIAALYAQQGNIQSVLTKVRSFLESPAFKNIGLQLLANSPANKHSYLDTIENLWRDLKSRIIYSRAFFSEAIFPSERLIELLSELLPNGRIEHTRIPLQIAAVDLDTGEDVLLDHGDLIRAVTASSAIPGIFSPVEFDGMNLVDGAVINAVPLIRTEREREVVIAVDTSHCIRSTYAKSTALDYIMRADEITNFRLNELHLRRADIVIRPLAVRRGHWADFSRAEEYMRSGEKAALAKLEEIKAVLQHRVEN